MKPRVGDCGEVELTHFDVYDGARCARECEVIVTLDTCGCLAPHMPKGQNGKREQTKKKWKLWRICCTS